MKHTLHRQWAVAVLLGTVLALPRIGSATARSCGADPVVNTADVLCLAPSGPCDATTVNLSAAIEVSGGGCAFDLGGRALNVSARFQMLDGDPVQITNAGDVTITATGKLESRGDAALPLGPGGTIGIVSSGTISHSGLLDVSGFDAGAITLTAIGDIDLHGGSTVVVRGNGISDPAAFGGTFQAVSSGGSVVIGGHVQLQGSADGDGGSVVVQAAVDLDVTADIQATGGSGLGGDVALSAGDDITLTSTIDVSSVSGGGFGGTIQAEAGVDALGGMAAGGSFVESAAGALLLNGSSALGFGGDGGELDVSTLGSLSLLGMPTAVEAKGAAPDGLGGQVFLVSADGDSTTVGPLDGDLLVSGTVSAGGGASDGFGGTLDVDAGIDLTLAGMVSLDGGNSGGELSGTAGGAIDVDAVVSAASTTAAGNGGAVELTAGEGSDAALTVAKNVVATGGQANSAAGLIRLAGCDLTVGLGVHVDGRAGVVASPVELVAIRPMSLEAGSQYLATQGGSITTTHPPGQDPVIDPSAFFNPSRVDNPTLAGSFPSCGGAAPATPTPSVTATATPAATVTVAPTATATPAATVTVAPTATETASGTPSATPTATETASGTPSATPTATETASGTPSETPTVTETASGTPSATPTATETASGTPSATPTATETASGTPSETPTATETASGTPSATPTATETASATPGATPTLAVTGTPTPTLTPTPAQPPMPCPTGLSRDAEDYLFLLERRAVLKTGTIVQGDLGVNVPGGALKVGRGAILDVGTRAAADRILVRADGELFDVFANTLQTNPDRAIIAGTVTSPMPLPVFFDEPLVVPDPFDPANFPADFPITCGGFAKTGDVGEGFVLPPGSYSKIRVGREGTLTLGAGVYNFCELRVVRASLVFTGPAVINVRDRFTLGDDSRAVPIGNVSPGDVQINVMGAHPVKVGQRSIFAARLFAPDALLRIGRGAFVTGHFVAEELRSDPGFTAPRCGDGAIECGETCDPPGLPAGGGPNLCRRDCTFCGDGLVQPGEECDDANTNDNDGCHTDCMLGP
jgi:cysteine-rich repeat protein